MSKNLSELSGRKGIENNLFDKMGKLAQEEELYPKKSWQDWRMNFLWELPIPMGQCLFTTS